MDYYRDEVNDSANENDNADNNLDTNKTTRSKSFEHKTKVIGSMPKNNNIDAKIVVPLKYLSSFWRSLHL